MEIRITPAPLRGTVAAVPSKSAAHRILILSALCARPTRLALGGTNDDIEATRRCLTALGCAFRPLEGGLEILPGPRPQQPPLLDCGESGSTLRFLLPVAAALGCGGVFVGKGRLPQRTIAPLVGQLCAHGCTADRPDGLPLHLGGRLTPGEFVLPGDVSSQFVTGLLLALPLLPGPSTVRLTSPLQSRSYVDLTVGLMRRFGLEVQAGGDCWNIAGNQTCQSPGTLAAEGDWSGAAFWLAAGALGGDILCTGLDPASAQGDKAIVTSLEQMGAPCRPENGGLRSCGRVCRGLRADVSQTPDLAPVLAALGAAAGESRLTGGARLRTKESDRLAAAADGLRALGCPAEELPDGLVLHGGGPLPGGTADAWGDHRMAMALAVAACACTGPVVIRGAEAVAKSYPAFWEEYRRLGGKIDVL